MLVNCYECLDWVTVKVLSSEMVTKGVPNDLELALDHDEEVVNFTAEFGERFVLEVLHLVEMLDKSD